MLEKTKEILKKHWFIMTILLCALIKQLLVANIPITPYPNQGYDDGMMVDMAISARAGKWMGEYTSNTLVKGPVFPIILAIINYFGLSYIGTMNIIYTIACMYFVYTIKDSFKSKKSLLAIYIFLLFNPVSYAWWTMQRVYRNGITLSQVLIIIGSLYAMYRKRNEKVTSMLPFSIIGGITFATLWLTREDGIWILPFTLVVIVLTLVLIILKNKNNLKNYKIWLPKAIATILPMIILITSLNMVRIVNFANYGVYTYNEINDGYFGKVIKTIYSAKTDEDIPYVTATRMKLNLLYEHSETFKSLKPYLEASMDSWAGSDDNPDRQVKDGLFWWALKEAVENAGYYETAEKSNEFYKKVYEELNAEIKAGKIETQMTMPSNLMSPWKMNYFTELPKAMFEIMEYIVNFEDVQTVNYAKDIPNDDKGNNKFEAITNNLAATNTLNNETNNVTKFTEKYVERVNVIGKIYKATGLILAITSFISYIIITVQLIRTKNKDEMMDIWLLFTGVICSFIVLVGGVSYNHITSCYSKFYMYLSGAYPLVGIFCMGNICYLIENRKNIFQKREER